jgi:hypothetical protein
MGGSSIQEAFDAFDRETLIADIRSTRGRSRDELLAEYLRFDQEAALMEAPSFRFYRLITDGERDDALDRLDRICGGT